MGLETSASPAPTSTFYFLLFFIYSTKFLLFYQTTRTNERTATFTIAINEQGLEMRMRLESLVFFNRTQQPPPLQQRPGGTRWKGSTYGAGDTDVSSSHKYVFYFLFFYTLLNFTFLLDYVCKQMNERPPLSDLIRERRTGTRWRGSTYGAGDVCGSRPHSTFIFLLFFYSTKFIFLLDYLIERANGHLDRHTQVPGQQRTGDSRHICLESLVFFFCYERFGRFFFFLLRFLQSKWFFVTSYKYGTTTNGHAH